MAALKLRDQLAGKKVVCVMSGANIDRATLTRVLGAACEIGTGFTVA
jgi:threonine dehydratase